VYHASLAIEEFENKW